MLNKNITQGENVGQKLAILNEFLKNNPENYTIDRLLEVLDCVAVAANYESERIGGQIILIVKELLQLFLKLKQTEDNKID